MKPKIKEGSLTYTILSILCGVGEITSEMLVSKYEIQKWMRRGMEGPIRKPAFRSTMSKLKSSGWIVKSRKNTQIFYNITKEGKQKFLIDQLKRKRLKRKKDEPTVVIFDIPEKYSRHRTFIRRLLIQMGFTVLQKSVMVGSYDLPDDFLKLLREWDLAKYFTYMNVKIIHKII
jgi:DNA-binding transcriptional regulator PaaX